jgi:signal peptidase I
VSEDSVRRGGDQHTSDDARRGGFSAIVREVAIVVALSLAIATVVRIFLVQAFLIPSESMEDTLLVNDRVLVSKISLRFDDIHRGDVVVFSDPDGWLGAQADAGNEGVGGAIKGFFEFVGVLPDDSQGHLIKRVIGVGGDTVECCDDAGRLTVNGTAIDESEYLYPGDEPSLTEFSVTVPDGDLFVMGDHRSNSGDSRMHGTFSEDEVVGRTFAIAWPVSRWTSDLSQSDEFADVAAP